MKKPDNVADNPNLLPYGSNVGAPSIKIDNINSWRQVNANKVNKHFSEKYNELKGEYEKLIYEFMWNELIYSAKYNFEPIIGETYHLFLNKKNDIFLSMVNPDEWDYKHVGSFVMDSNNKWNKV